MSATPQHNVVRHYLDDLSDATHDLPRDRRRELLAEIDDHITEALSPDATEVDARQVLHRLGSPGEIAAAERERLGIAAPGAGTMERITIALLLIGFIATPIAWLVGVIMLWMSKLWTTRDKLIGTLVVPGGLGLAVIPLVIGLGGSGQECSGGTNQPTVCTGGPSTTALIAGIMGELLLIAAPICTAVYLARRLRPPTPTT